MDIEKEEGEGEEPRDLSEGVGALQHRLRWNIMYLNICQGKVLFDRIYSEKQVGGFE